MTLTEFLLARIAEDEAWNRRNRGGDPMFPGSINRTFAECEAKRRIVAIERERLDAIPVPAEIKAKMVNPDGSGIMYALALPYADHPDYREEWKP